MPGRLPPERAVADGRLADRGDRSCAIVAPDADTTHCPLASGQPTVDVVAAFAEVLTTVTVAI
ncbi:hypothetical protein [Dactylosporangium sp. NPDC049140]|uniref:hypothetical protein n=1 Tax=Dactylosporangium sp. NPDC049140 TaxID=3155647 RepID=UPI0033DA1919